jgi:uncharacterized lipoprotein YajG
MALTMPQRSYNDVGPLFYSLFIAVLIQKGLSMKNLSQIVAVLLLIAACAIAVIACNSNPPVTAATPTPPVIDHGPDYCVYVNIDYRTHDDVRLRHYADSNTCVTNTTVNITQLFTSTRDHDSVTTGFIGKTFTLTLHAKTSDLLFPHVSVNTYHGQQVAVATSTNYQDGTYEVVVAVTPY